MRQRKQVESLEYSPLSTECGKSGKTVDAMVDSDPQIRGEMARGHSMCHHVVVAVIREFDFHKFKYKQQNSS